jgi:hypothetical protein
VAAINERAGGGRSETNAFDGVALLPLAAPSAPADAFCHGRRVLSWRARFALGGTFSQWQHLVPLAAQRLGCSQHMRQDRLYATPDPVYERMERLKSVGSRGFGAGAKWRRKVGRMPISVVTNVKRLPSRACMRAAALI